MKRIESIKSPLFTALRLPEGQRVASGVPFKSYFLTLGGPNRGPDGF